MEKIVEQGLLYDFYGELLTEHQRNIYEDAVYNDMSLAEIAEQYGISRQGVHDLIKRCNKLLVGYEEKLQLVKKFTEAKKTITKIDTLAEEGKELPEEECRKHLDSIRKLTAELMENF
ncbi:MAG: YlxM family DNA-binding protein [Lachnospiraceae bacterium]|nr:YlxM family DNA-binding protein [Lachnospiraceae bacterium]